MNDKSENRPNLKQYKRHVRKFPWSIVIRTVAIMISLAIVYYLIKETIDLTKQNEETPFEIEIETNEEVHP